MTDAQREAIETVVTSLPWRNCSESYAAQVGPHSYVVRWRTINEDEWALLNDFIRTFGTRQLYLRTSRVSKYLILTEYRLWVMGGIINRARHEDVAGMHEDV
jgi:hypothetical protein